jgi:hypothetical protein
MLENRLTQLETELDRLIFSRRRLWDMLDIQKQLAADSPSSTPESQYFIGQRSDLYGVTSTNESGYLIPEQQEEKLMRHMADEMPYTYMSYVVDQTILEGSSDTHSHWMMLSPRPQPEWAREHVLYFPSCLCLYGTILCYKWSRPTRQDFLPMLSYIEENGWKIAGPAMGCVRDFFDTNDAENPHSYLTASIPIQIPEGKSM